MDHLKVLRGLNFGFAGLWLVVCLMAVVFIAGPFLLVGGFQDSMGDMVDASDDDFHRRDPNFFPASNPEANPFHVLGRGAQGLGLGLALAVSAFPLLLAAFHVVLGFRLKPGQGRVMQTVALIFYMASVPFGTAYAVYALWVCWLNRPTARFFEAGQVQSVTA